MRSRSKGHAVLGGCSALLGVACLALGVVRPDGAVVLGTPASAIFVSIGFVLALAGGFILAFSLRAPAPEPDVVPAHVAFNSRMVAASTVPALPSARPLATAARGSAPPRGFPKIAPASAPAQQRVAPSRGDIEGLTVQIQELTKKINKAGVMLAMGQLSQEGYLAYVDDLKRQRGNLEAARVRAEMRST